MKLQEQISVSSPAFSWLGAEVLSILQLSFFLVLGYAVTRTWMWSRSGTIKKTLKKIDDVDQSGEEAQGSESDATPMSKAKAGSRQSNAVERRTKKKKSKEVDAGKLQNELIPVPSAEPSVEKEEQPKELPQAPEEPSPPQEVKEPEQVQTQEIEAPLEEPQEVPVPEEVIPKKQMSEEKLAKMMAKKAERKARKAQETVVPEEQMITSQESFSEEDKKQTVEGVRKEPFQSDIVTTAFVDKSDAEALSDDAQTTSVPTSMVEASSEEDALPGTPEALQALPGISTPEECPSPRGPQDEPLAWCGLPQVPQIEGWMAVAVPAEFAPPGAPGPFDGLWENKEEERIVIDHDEIVFVSGMKWVMQQHSLTQLSVKLGDEEFKAELDVAERTLNWSDGDVWKCVGETDGQQKWAAQREANGLPGVLLGGEQFMQMNGMAMPPMPLAQNQMPPEDAKEWEICWDWAKKGWCKRGNECEWYHPCVMPQFQPCQPCDSAPFGDLL